MPEPMHVGGIADGCSVGAVSQKIAATTGENGMLKQLLEMYELLAGQSHGEWL